MSEICPSKKLPALTIELFTQGGLLKTYKPADPEGPKTLLPQETDKHECEIEQRKQETENRKCFLAGKINLFNTIHKLWLLKIC